jgi:hypothetical protein
MNDVKPADTITDNTSAGTPPLPNVSALLNKSAPTSDPPTEIAQRESCGNCHFMRMAVNGAQVVMECREDSPKVFQIQGPRGQFGTMGVFPPTRKELWCGKFSPKAKA